MRDATKVATAARARERAARHREVNAWRAAAFTGERRSIATIHVTSGCSRLAPAHRTHYSVGMTASRLRSSGNDRFALLRRRNQRFAGRFPPSVTQRIERSCDEFARTADDLMFNF